MNAKSGSLCPRYLNPWFRVHRDREDQGGDGRKHPAQGKRQVTPAKDGRGDAAPPGGQAPCERLTSLTPQLTTTVISLSHRRVCSGTCHSKKHNFRPCPTVIRNFKMATVDIKPSRGPPITGPRGCPDHRLRSHPVQRVPDSSRRSPVQW